MSWQCLIGQSVSFLSSENSQSPVVEAGGSHGHMSPEEHYRRMMSALSEQGSYEEQQQRLYQLASSMGLPGHGQSINSVFVCVLIISSSYWLSNIVYLSSNVIFTFRIGFFTLRVRISGYFFFCFFLYFKVTLETWDLL